MNKDLLRRINQAKRSAAKKEKHIKKMDHISRIKLEERINNMNLKNIIPIKTKKYDFGIVSYSLDCDGIHIHKVSLPEGCSDSQCLEKVYFPDKIDGKKVVVVNKHAFSDFSCEELFMPSGINLRESAFDCSDIPLIHLPGVKLIPYECFLFASLEAVLDSDDVEIVEPSAFRNNENLKEFHWFPKCKTIPTNCFSCSGLETITNLEHVNKIGSGAFSQTNIQEIFIPSKCVLSFSCFERTPIQEIRGGEVLFLHSKMFNDCDCKSIRLPDCLDLTLCLSKHINSGQNFFETNFEAIVTIIKESELDEVALNNLIM